MTKMVDTGIRKERPCQVISFAHHVTRLRNTAQNTKDKHALDLYYHSKRILDFQNGQAREDDHYAAAGICMGCNRPLDVHDDHDDREVERGTSWNPFKGK